MYAFTCCFVQRPRENRVPKTRFGTRLGRKNSPLHRRFDGGGCKAACYVWQEGEEMAQGSGRLAVGTARGDASLGHERVEQVSASLRVQLHVRNFLVVARVIGILDCLEFLGT